jgi:putative ABC transport system substrate-binding protein
MGEHRRKADGRRVQQRDGAVVVVADPVIFGQRRQIVELAARHKLPAVYDTQDFTNDGGLLSYGPHPQERFQKMADYVDRILNGTKFELVINLKTAKALGLMIPAALLVRADQIIE